MFIFLVHFWLCRSGVKTLRELVFEVGFDEEGSWFVPKLVWDDLDGIKLEKIEGKW